MINKRRFILSVDSTTSSSDATSTEKDTAAVSKVSMKAILLMVLPDIHLVIIGSVFMICASVCQTFLPLLTGRVVSSKLLSVLFVLF